MTVTINIFVALLIAIGLSIGVFLVGGRHEARAAQALASAEGALATVRKEASARKRVKLFSELDEDERRKLFAIPDPHPTPDQQLEKKESNAILWGEVGTLSAREAAVLTRWAHSSSFGEIAEALGISPSTVRVLWMRGIQHLRARPRVQQLAA